MMSFHARLIVLALLVSGLSQACKDKPADQSAESGVVDAPVTPSAVTPEPPAKDYLAIGENFAKVTSLLLQQELNKVLGERGPAEALEYCSVRANPVTDSLANLLNARIRRVTDKPRNPANQADEYAVAYLASLRVQKADGLPLGSLIMESNGEYKGYYPIVTNTMCLACHGKPETDIAAPTLKKIKKLYPQDKATGYGPDEVRGLWIVEFSETGSPGTGQ